MFYKDKTILLATKHHKEQVIAPTVEKALKSKVFTTPDFDTDQFGTFCGTVKRPKTAYETVVQKAKTAAQQYGYDFAIANEGSFGAHPEYFFIPGDVELITLVDVKRNLDITECFISTETNYAYIDLTPETPYQSFLEKAQFPSHGLVLKALNEPEKFIAKGIQDLKTLETLLKESFSTTQTLRLETDMRAMMNPSRMKVIEAATHKLAERLLRICPQCDYPGFGKRSTQGYLLCESCELPTPLYQYQVESCVACKHSLTSPRADGLKKALMGQCQYCNP